MLLQPLIAVTGLAAAASAFLLPPEVTDAEIQAIEAIGDAVGMLGAHAQTVDLECTGCPPVFNNHHDKHHGKPKHHKQHPSHLALDFAVEQARLTVNGFELYPHSDPLTNTLVAPQVAEPKKHHNKHHKDDKTDSKTLKSHHKFRPHELTKSKSVEQQLGFSLQVHPVSQTDEELHLDVIVVDLQIIEVGSVFVDGLPNIRVHLLKSPDNELMIGKIEQTASENTQTPGSECTTVLCKWRAMLAEQFGRLKTHGCAGMLGHKAGHSGHGHHGQPHGEQPEIKHHRHSHGWALLFRKLTSHIILPVLVGIVAGVTVSILGMIVGTLLVGLWRTFVRGQSFFPSHSCRRFSRSSHRHHKAAQNDAAFVEEKSSLMASQEDDELPPPPSYQDKVDVNHVESV